jgi:hypothetical protein
MTWLQTLLQISGEGKMSGMDDRSEAYENKFAHDEELRFKAEARRNKLLGLWAAELLGKKDDEADAYAKEVVVADFEEAGDNDVFRKIRADFDAAGVQQSDHQIRRTMDELMQKATQQILSE